MVTNKEDESGLGIALLNVSVPGVSGHYLQWKTTARGALAGCAQLQNELRFFVFELRRAEEDLRAAPARKGLITSPIIRSGHAERTDIRYQLIAAL